MKLCFESLILRFNAPMRRIVKWRNCQIIFHLQLKDNPGERTILLKRQYEDETITIQVDIPNVAAEDEDEGNDEEENHDESSIPLVVNISKSNGVTLELGVSAAVFNVSSARFFLSDNFSVGNQANSAIVKEIGVVGEDKELKEKSK